MLHQTQTVCLSNLLHILLNGMHSLVQKNVEIKPLPLTEAKLGAVLQDIPALEAQYFVSKKII